MKTCTFNQLTHKVMPIKLTEDMYEACYFLEYRDHIEEDYGRLLEAAPEYPADAGWIPCSERLPEDRNEYLCFSVAKNGNKYIKMEQLNPAKTAFYVEYDGDEPAEKITHWMPLPPVPEGV